MNLASIFSSCRGALSRFWGNIRSNAAALLDNAHLPESDNTLQPGAPIRLPAANEFDCSDRLQPGEPYFVLRAQDATASGVVRAWAEIAKRNKLSPAKIASAIAVAEAMEAWPHSRMPD